MGTGAMGAEAGATGQRSSRATFVGVGSGGTGGLCGNGVVGTTAAAPSSIGSVFTGVGPGAMGAETGATGQRSPGTSRTAVVLGVGSGGRGDLGGSGVPGEDDSDIVKGLRSV